MKTAAMIIMGLLIASCGGGNDTELSGLEGKAEKKGAEDEHIIADQIQDFKPAWENSVTGVELPDKSHPHYYKYSIYLDELEFDSERFYKDESKDLEIQITVALGYVAGNSPSWHTPEVKERFGHNYDREALIKDGMWVVVTQQRYTGDADTVYELVDRARCRVLAVEDGANFALNHACEKGIDKFLVHIELDKEFVASEKALDELDK